MAAISTVKKRRRGPINPQSLILKQLGAHWHALSGVQKNEWERLTQQVSNPMHPAQARFSNGFATFVGLNSNLLNSGLAMLRDAPLQPDLPQPLPGLSLGVFNTGGHISFLLTAAAPTGPVLIYGAAPLLASRRVCDTTKFKLLGPLAALNGVVDVTELYGAQYILPEPGYQAALRVVGISAQGFRSPGALVTAPSPVPATVSLQLKAA